MLLVTHRTTGFIILGACLLTLPHLLSAWTGPTSAPPNSNVSAPVNLGSSDQVKNAGLSLNSLAVFGNTILSGTTNYLNFGTTAGITGYGIRNNSGILELKHNGDTWLRLGGVAAGTTDYVTKYTSSAGIGASIIVDTGTNVGVGTTSPFRKFSVTGDVQVTGNIYAAGYFHNSDRRLKSHVQTLSGLDTLMRLRGVSYVWRGSGFSALGVVAQEVEDVLPQAVHTDERGFKSVEYDQLIPILIEAVKEQQAEIEELRYEIKNHNTGR